MSFAQLSFNVKAGLNLSSYIGDNSESHPNSNPEYVLVSESEYQFTDIISLQPHCFSRRKVQSIRKDTKVSWMLMQM